MSNINQLVEHTYVLNNGNLKVIVTGKLEVSMWVRALDKVAV